MAEGRLAQLQKIYDDSGAPGAAPFRRAVVKAGLKLTDAEARAFVHTQSTAHVFQGRLRSDGRVTASRENEIFQADLIDYSKRTGPLQGGHRFILTVVDVFSRRLWVEPLGSKQPAEVVKALERILRSSGRPHQITTDMGAEFGKPFDELLTKEGIAHCTKDP